MKVLQISSHYNQGGAGKIAANIHKELLKQGVDSYVTYGRGKKTGKKNGRIYRFNYPIEIYFSALLSRISGLNGWTNILATKRLIKHIEMVKPDVLHLHALHGYYLNFELLFSYINDRDLPCVWTFHDCHAFVGNCGYFFDCRKWETGCDNCPYLSDYPRSLFFDKTKYMWERKKELFTSSKNTVIVTPSNWLAREVEKSYFNRYDCITINNGIDTDNTFYPRGKSECRSKHGFDENEKIVLGISVGFSDPRKGAKYIIEAAKALEKGVKVVLIGWDEKNNHLLDGLTNVVTIPRIADACLLAEYYSLADVFVIPSLAENYATVTLEAMACGTPVVGFAAGGTTEQLANGRGISVRLGSSEEFIEALRTVLSGNHNLVPRDDLAAITQKENSATEMTAKYIKVYNSLCQNTK